jgi:PAS domain S-box-containing protein
MDLERIHSVIAESARAPAVACSLEGDLLYMNPAAEQLLGGGLDDIVGSSWTDLLAELPLGLQTPLSSISRLTSFAGHVRAPGQPEKPVHVTVLPTRDQSGVCGFVMVLEDMPDFQELLEALRESEMRYRALVENMLNGLVQYRVVVDEQGRPIDAIFCEANLAFESITGIKREAVIGMRVTEVRPDVDREWVELIGQVALTGVPVRFERHSPRMGKWFAMLAYCPREGYCAIVSEDITERVQAMQALQESEQHCRELVESAFDNAGDGIFIVDAAGHFLEANRVLVQRLGRTPESLPQTSLDDVYGQGFLASLKQRVMAAAMDEPAVLEATERASDGVTIGVELSARRVNYHQQPALLAVVRDISERRRAEDAQRLAALGQLSAGVAHEFNNLLAAMMMKAELAAYRKSPDQFMELAEQVVRACRRGAEICQNLIAFASPREMQRELLHIEEPIEAALAIMVRQMAHADIVVKRDYLTTGCRVLADPGQLEQVFLNLFINAGHAMPAGGTLEITTRQGTEADEGSIVVTVSDTGVGISDEELSRVFEPFFTTKGLLGQSDTPGTGLGLSVSHGIIKAHGGSISVHSESGHGTRFVVTVPVWVEHAGQPGVDPQVLHCETPTGENCRVLVAEDEADIASLLAKVLRDRGYEVSVASDTAQALQVMNEQKLDLIVADWLMPGGGGREIVASSRDRADCPPIVIITGKLGLELMPELEPSVVRCLQKPFHLAELLQVISDVLGHDQ